MANKQISNKLKELRIKAGYTQKQVYDRLKISQSTFSSWETGKSEPDAKTFLLLCKLYDVKDILFEFMGQAFDPEVKFYEPTRDALDVAQAYDKADFKDKNIARQALDLPPLEPPAKEVSLSDDRKFAV